MGKHGQYSATSWLPELAQLAGCHAGEKPPVPFQGYTPILEYSRARDLETGVLIKNSNSTAK